MWTIRNVIIILLVSSSSCLGDPREGFGPGLQDWDFVEVRPGAHMFYWLYYTTAEVKNYTDRPLIIWLQGGPGTSSMYGNFEELGPWTLDQEERPHTWVKNYNVLFIDSPVGTGFSYVDNLELLAKTNSEIVDDLVAFTKEFYLRNPEFKDVPLHIYGEHYGGKTVPELAWALHSATQSGEIDIKLESIGMVTPWVSPIDSVLSYAPSVLNMGLVDTKGYEEIQAAALETENLFNQGRFEEATFQWGTTQHTLLRNTGPISWYNVLQRWSDSETQGRRLIPEEREQALRARMRDTVADFLQLPMESVFDSQGAYVFNGLIGDFMKPACNAVGNLLDNTDIEVVVVAGQLDLLVSTVGTVRWIEKLLWEGRNQYRQAPRNTVGRNGIVEGYEKSYGRLHVYWALRSGQMVPAENAALMGHVLEKHVG